jgi:spermidine synthase
MTARTRRSGKRAATAANPAAPPWRSPLVFMAALLAIPVVIAVAAFGLWPSGDTATAARVTGEPGLVEKVESLYNDIYLLRRRNGDFALMFGAERVNYVESIVNPDDEMELPVYYTQSMTAGLAYAARLDSAAIIGLGGGRTAWYHHKSVPGLEFTAVELDPEVARIAAQYFGVRPERNFDVVIRDGRVHLARSEATFDIILIDAYRGPFVPFHLLTTEFYRLVAEHLRPGGVAVQNVEPSTMLFDSAVATIRAAFDHVVFVRGPGNIVIVAYNGDELDEATVRARAAERQAQYGLRYDLTEILGRRFSPEWNAATEPLTDDFAPVEYLKAIERHNERRG